MCQLSFTQLSGFSALYENPRAHTAYTHCSRIECRCFSLFLIGPAHSFFGVMSICLLCSLDPFLPLSLSHPCHLPSPLFFRSLHLSLYPFSPVYFPILSSLFASANFPLYISSVRLSQLLEISLVVLL